ncbi:site-specific integrase [Natronogracilivirga saccharolytica]|uniref:Site-specific integrase n=1 Tax=Natronogracilivirga saccharolytica TaxID=2812953 RepID=A0A8J7RVW0_9BACT|nr:site-specific integrase [Natronogracilivirga saccharolytica]MBP3193902.1 site-specific integrase [Natronogracilivirga saccharolytica]
MATSIHLYLRKDAKKRNGECPIYLRITDNRKHRYISTGVSVQEKCWNQKREMVRRNHPNPDTLNEKLQQRIKEAQNAETELGRGGKVSAKAIRERIQVGKKGDFFNLADEWYDELVATGKYHQSKTLKVVLKKLESFEGERLLPLSQIDTAYLEKFESYISRTFENKGNTINKTFKIIRRVLKMAMKAYLMREDPFINFKGAKRVKDSEKTKLHIEQIKAIEELNLATGSALWHARNAFLFSFYSGGIRFGDICCLKWENVKNGRLSYNMNKNEKPFSTKLSDYHKAILSEYSGSKDEYIFPFLNSKKKYDLLDLRKAISSRNVIVNKNLKKIVELVNEELEKNDCPELIIEGSVSFHVSRHSFAQHAVESGLDVYELMQTLRHTKIETTQSYLKSLDEKLADKAMSKVF